ncbi:MAG: protein tyrosine/serine phosphatase [Rhizobacter sp.]|nr:protein tyrosine/serine phosphatase [Rhizobacter sp.]
MDPKTSFEVEGAHNLRDLGGLVGAGGRLLRHGRLIRSGELNGLRDAGAQRLAQLGLARIVDFRSATERNAAPTTAQALAQVARWETSATETLGDPVPLLRRCLVSTAQSREVVHGIYRKMPYLHRVAYRALIEAVAEGRPVLFHCAAGKDRTGAAAALLLSLAGVDRDAIRADYAASHAVVEQTTAAFLAKPGSAIATGIAPEIWAPLMASDPAYLDTMFDEIKRGHGSVEGYAADVLDLPTDISARLRDALLA